MSTKEVANGISLLSFIEDASVYGVPMPGNFYKHCTNYTKKKKIKPFKFYSTKSVSITKNMKGTCGF